MAGTYMYFLGLIMLGLAQGVTINHNVAFQKLNEITTTRSRWLITFVIDLEPYNKLMTRLYNDITRTTALTWNVVEHYTVARSPFQEHFRRLGEELKVVMESFNVISGTFDEYRTLYTTRQKRSLLPFVGKGLHFLFGTVSDSDLDAIKRNMADLANNQRKHSHVVEESLSVVNMTRVEIAENRQTINKLIEGVDSLDERMQNITEKLEKQILGVEMFVTSYAQVDLVIEEVKLMIDRVANYVEQLHLQVNMLSLGRLAPSTITPSNLKILLSGVKSLLVPPLTLPGDPVKDLWKYYQFLTCTTVVQEQKILVIVPIPLLDFNDNLGIYRVHNLPVPFAQTNIKGKLEPMTAQYELESSAIAVDQSRTRFALLTEEEVEACSKPLIGFCAIKSPIYPLNVNQFCVTAVFMNRTETINSHCQTNVKLNTILPVAKYITDGLWVISTNQPLRFSVSCQSQPVFFLTALPPLSIVQLNMTCGATSDRMTLTPYYQQESQFQLYTNLKYSKVGISNMSSLWEPFHKALPNFTRLQLPSELGTIKEMPMQQLIDRVRQIREIKKAKGRSIWFYLSVASAILVLTAILGFVGYFGLYKNGLSKLWSGPMMRLWKGKSMATKPELESATGKPVGDGDAP